MIAMRLWARSRHYSLIIATALMMMGCAVGPDYQTPETPLPASWQSADGASVKTIDQAWWQNFHDPVLTLLVAKAIAGNFDLQIAEARIAKARAARAVADASLLPTGEFKSSATREANILAVPGNFPGITNPFNIFQSGFDASWELDLFGGHRRESEAANAELQASEASRDDALVSLMAEVARTYVDIRHYQAQLAITDDRLGLEKKMVRIATQRFDSGNAPGIDVAQAEAQLQQAKAQLPLYENLVTQAKYSMDALLGEQPGLTQRLIDNTGTIPVSDKTLLVAAPAVVIANRPDIRAAERKLASATAQQGVAVAKFFPDISLSGFLGLLNTNAGDLARAASKSWMIGGDAVWPILNFGTLSGNLDAANAQQQEAMAAYRKTMVGALADVEKSVTAYLQQEKYTEALSQSMAANRHAADISRQRYKEGLTSYLEVLDALRSYYASQSQLSDAQAKTCQNLISAYKSLGGGWEAKVSK